MNSLQRLLAGVGYLGAVIALAPASHAQEAHTIHFLSTTESSCAPYPQWNAQVFGFWDEEALTVNFLPTETTVPYAAFLQNGEADVAMLDSAQVLQAVDNSLPVQVIYEALQFAPDGIVVFDESPIQSLVDLRDSTIGLASDRDLITTVIAVDSIDETLESLNITTVVVGDSGPVLARSLRDGTIDAFAGGSGDRAGIEAAGMKIRNITPLEVSRNPGNSMVVWGPTLEEKRPIFEKFLRGWAKAQHAGIVDTKLSAAACRTKIPEQFENIEVGLRLINNHVYTHQVRRTKDYGELQPDVWNGIQPPYLKQNEISKLHDAATFLDASFIPAANDWKTDDVKRAIEAWKDANPDKLIP